MWYVGELSLLQGTFFGVELTVSMFCFILLMLEKVSINFNLLDGFGIDLATVFDAILTRRQTREKLQCLYKNLMSNNFRKTAVLKKKY